MPARPPQKQLSGTYVLHPSQHFAPRLQYLYDTSPRRALSCADGQYPPPPGPGAEAEGAGPPPSPPEVSSKPRENGADNFPGFWRPPAAGSADAGPADAAGAPASTSQRRVCKRQQREPEQGDCGGEQTPCHAGPPGRERRVSPAATSLSLPKHACPYRLCGLWDIVCPAFLPLLIKQHLTHVPSRLLLPHVQVRFSLPDAEQELADACVQPPASFEQQPGAPAPLLVAPPVLPSGGSRNAGSSSGGGRPGTPAKPAPLRMPQPPAYSRFG